jgi:hypothetical protein
MQRTVAAGLGQIVLLDEILADLRAAAPGAVGIASAYVTVSGVESITPVLRRAGVRVCRLVAGLDDEITHPEALRLAVSRGWDVRIARAPQGRFHPKMIVGGRRFDGRGAIISPSFFYVGSGNLTYPGLARNAECAVLGNDGGALDGSGQAFAEFWNQAEPATAAAIDNYGARFAERSRTRRAEVLEALGVSEDRSVRTATVATLRVERPPRLPAVTDRFATTAWTGLQSFTGEYRFQVEFPRAAGEVVRRLVGAAPGGAVNVACEDGTVRVMRYRFYRDNGMFRLNVPNDVPGVAWARANKDGLAVVSRGPEGGARLRLAILMPGTDTKEVVARSYALNTWGRTRTRLYGWF